MLLTPCQPAHSCSGHMGIVHSEQQPRLRLAGSWRGVGMAGGPAPGLGQQVQGSGCRCVHTGSSSKSCPCHLKPPTQMLRFSWSAGETGLVCHPEQSHQGTGHRGRDMPVPDRTLHTTHTHTHTNEPSKGHSGRCGQVGGRWLRRGWGGGLWGVAKAGSGSPETRLTGNPHRDTVTHTEGQQERGRYGRLTW